jgi:hypothetical protein
MKMKVNVLAEAFAGQSGGPQLTNPGRGRGNPRGQRQIPPGCPHPREELG